MPRIDLEWNAPDDIARMLNEAMHLLKTEQRVKVTNDDVKFRDLRALYRNVFCHEKKQVRFKKLPRKK